jgi:lipopolysaccharide transport system permease protein
MKSFLKNKLAILRNKFRSEGIPVTIIESSSGWRLLDLKELFEYKDLFYFLVWRNIKILYAQTILGFSWALLQPLIQIIIFTIVFGKVARLDTDGIPYVLFTTVAIIPWTYMSQSMTQSSQSLVAGQAMLGKIYFPRLLFPVTPVLAKLIDFVLSFLIIICVLIYYGRHPTWNIIFIPLFFVLMMVIPAGVGLWLSALAIRYRDVKYVMQFAIRMLLYTAPIVYSASSIPQKYRVIYSMNPIVAVIEGYRSCLLGLPLQWQYVYPGIFTAFILIISGALYFKRMENIFVDVI